MTTSRHTSDLEAGLPVCAEVRVHAEPSALDEREMDHIVACDACRTYFAARTCD